MLVSSIAAAQTISVRVTNIDTTKPGNILAMLFAREGFPKEHDKALIIQKKLATANEMVFSFIVDQELFAVKILHDENQDGKASKDWTGIIPSEGLGFTNGAKLSWRGAPKFKDAVLDLSKVEGEIIIPIIYP